MPNIARRLVESFLAFRFPDCNGDLARRMERVEVDAGRKTRILRFLNTYSHSGGIAEPEHDPSVLAETRTVLGEVMEMIKNVDPTHYTGMAKLVGATKATT
ncbi:MAG: AAA family ATPase [Thermoanaerobaculales bacterium]